MKKIIITIVFLLALIGKTFSQDIPWECKMLFGPLHKNIAFRSFGGNEDYFWSTLSKVKSIEERKKIMTQYTIDITIRFINVYLEKSKECPYVTVSSYVNDEKQHPSSIEKVIDLREAAFKKDWNAMEKAANQLSFGYDTYLYY